MHTGALRIQDVRAEEAQIVRLVNTGHYDEMADRYMNGGCLAFTYALWIAHDMGATASAAILSNDEADGWGEIDHDATHAYLEISGSQIDIRGIRDVEDMADELGLWSWSIAAEMHPDDAVTTYAGGFSDDVQEGEYPHVLHKDDIVDALVHIANNPERYGLHEK